MPMRGADCLNRKLLERNAPRCCHILASKDKAVQELGEQISDEETDATILKPADPSAADKIIDDILEGGLIETAPETASEIDPDTTLNEETTPNEEWESERDKGSATTYSSPAECPGGTELAEDGSCMVLEE